MHAWRINVILAGFLPLISWKILLYMYVCLCVCMHTHTHTYYAFVFLVYKILICFIFLLDLNIHCQGFEISIFLPWNVHLESFNFNIKLLHRDTMVASYGTLLLLFRQSSPVILLRNLVPLLKKRTTLLKTLRFHSF